MWRKPLNSVVLVAVTHRRLGRVSDGISIQVVACIINKLRAKISQRRLYNERDPLGTGAIEKLVEKTLWQQELKLYPSLKKIYSRTTLLRFCRERISLTYFVFLCFLRISLTKFVFLCFLTIFNSLCVLFDPLKPSF